MALSTKSKRCYHRVISGLEKGGDFRFLTLTSGPDSPEKCQRSWRVLYMRMKRRGYIRSYIKVPEYSKNMKQHLHVIIEGDYVTQAYISEQWKEIHHAKIVDIRRVRNGNGKRGLADYMAKYMSKENAERYSWSWSWVWKGFCKDWKLLKRLWHYHNSFAANIPFEKLLLVWKHFLKQKRPDFLRLYLMQYGPPKDWSYMDI